MDWEQANQVLARSKPGDTVTLVLPDRRDALGLYEVGGLLILDFFTRSGTLIVDSATSNKLTRLKKEAIALDGASRTLRFRVASGFQPAEFARGMAEYLEVIEVSN